MAVATKGMDVPVPAAGNDADSARTDVLQQNHIPVGQTPARRSGMYIAGSWLCSGNHRCDSLPGGCCTGTFHAVPLWRGKDAMASDHLSGSVAHGISGYDIQYARWPVDLVGVHIPGTVVLRFGPERMPEIYRKHIGRTIPECSEPAVYPHHQPLSAVAHGSEWLYAGENDLRAFLHAGCHVCSGGVAGDTIIFHNKEIEH